MMMTFADDCWNAATLLWTWATPRLRLCSAIRNVPQCSDFVMCLLPSGRQPWMSDVKAYTLHTKTSAYYDKTVKALKSLRISTDMSIQDHDTKLWNKVCIIIGIGRCRDFYIKLP